MKEGYIVDFSDKLLTQRDLPKQIRDYVFERDNFSCRSCNSSDNIHPHHIIYRSETINHSPDNLVTVCFKCHRLIHDGKLDVINVNGNFFFMRFK